jgi:Cu/Ag efflux protein CusF
MNKIIISTALTLALAALHPAFAADQLADAAQTVVSSADPVEITAQIVAIDRAARVVTLRGPRGNDVDIAVGPQVGNFDQLRVGDHIDVFYKNALLVTAENVSAAGKDVRMRVDTSAALPASSGYDATRQIEIQATLEKIDRSKRKVTLRGAYRTVTLDVGPDVDLAKLKVGDTIHAVFVSAYAARVVPANAADTAH